jgi:hypothetical protein
MIAVADETTDRDKRRKPVRATVVFHLNRFKEIFK